MILLGDCLERLKELADNSVDSVVTDPPAGISFMSKKWDDDKGGRDQWIQWLSEIMREVSRTLKPGGHMLVWAIPRTSHWTATAIENAGFEIRDVITHHFGSGFPKSLDVSKAIDKAAGVKREVIGFGNSGRDMTCGNYGNQFEKENMKMPITTPSTDLAKQWAGWGTSLKPASEHWILARKPLAEKTVAKNVLKHGTGALNIDASRIGTEQTETTRGITQTGPGGWKTTGFDEPTTKLNPPGRWPANLILGCDCESDAHEPECPVAILDGQSGEFKGETGRAGRKSAGNYEASNYKVGVVTPTGTKDFGGASRFFKVIKPDQYDNIGSCLDAESATKLKSKTTPETIALGGVPRSLPLDDVGKSQSSQSIAPTAENTLKSTQETCKEQKFSVQKPAMPSIDSASRCPDAKFAEKSATSIEIASVLEAVKTTFKNDHQLLQCLDSIPDYKKCILLQDLALSVESLESIGITEIIQSCLRLFGSAPLATASNTQDLESDTEFGLGQTRFLYQAKASKRERNLGLEGMPEKFTATMGNGIGKREHDPNEPTAYNKNFHPTVKPTRLMGYLIKLITPPNGTVLDPFMGSGSTAVAAFKNGFKFIGIERDEEYFKIAEKRIEHTLKNGS